MSETVIISGVWGSSEDDTHTSDKSLCQNKEVDWTHYMTAALGGDLKLLKLLWVTFCWYLFCQIKPYLSHLCWGWFNLIKNLHLLSCTGELITYWDFLLWKLYLKSWFCSTSLSLHLSPISSLSFFKVLFMSKTNLTTDISIFFYLLLNKIRGPTLDLKEDNDSYGQFQEQLLNGMHILGGIKDRVQLFILLRR